MGALYNLLCVCPGSMEIAYSEMTLYLVVYDFIYFWLIYSFFSEYYLHHNRYTN